MLSNTIKINKKKLYLNIYIYLYEIGIVMIRYTYDWHYVRCNLIEEFNSLCSLIYKNNLIY